MGSLGKAKQPVQSRRAQSSQRTHSARQVSRTEVRILHNLRLRIASCLSIPDDDDWCPPLLPIPPAPVHPSPFSSIHQIIAIKRQADGLQGDALRSWLAARGYTDAVQVASFRHRTHSLRDADVGAATTRTQCSRPSRAESTRSAQLSGLRAWEAMSGADRAFGPQEKGTGDTLWEKQLVEADSLEAKASEAESKLAELKEQVLFGPSAWESRVEGLGVSVETVRFRIQAGVRGVRALGFGVQGKGFGLLSGPIAFKGERGKQGREGSVEGRLYRRRSIETRE
eukprot:3133743-Rhodomonas_salina.2